LTNSSIILGEDVSGRLSEKLRGYIAGLATTRSYRWR
jgi:hypothetical protein